MRLLRILWRVLTFLIVVASAYATAFLLVPYLDRRMPIFFSLLLGYGVLAYLLLPLVLRFWRIVFKPHHIPQYVITGDGWPSEPVNIAIVATSKKHLIKTMQHAGWYVADPLTLTTGWKALWAIVLDRSYPQAPMTNLYLFGHRQDIGFEKPHKPNLSPRTRHHVRFWRVNMRPRAITTDQSHFSHWRDVFKGYFSRRHTVWLGAATNEPYTIDLRWRDLQFTHGNDGNHAKERDYIIDTLSAIGSVKTTAVVKAGEPFKMRAQNIRKTFIVDGTLTIVTLTSKFTRQ